MLADAETGSMVVKKIAAAAIFRFHCLDSCLIGLARLLKTTAVAALEETKGRHVVPDMLGAASTATEVSKQTHPGAPRLVAAKRA